MSELGLSEVIRALRAELDEAMTAGEGERVQFEANSVELELQVGVTREADARGGVRFWVFEFGASGSHARESIQRVQLSLTPVAAGGGGVKIARGANESPLEE